MVPPIAFIKCNFAQLPGAFNMADSKGQISLFVIEINSSPYANRPCWLLARTCNLDSGAFVIS